MSKRVLRRAVNGLFGMFGAKRTQNVFSPLASNRYRQPASGGFVTSESAAYFAWPGLQGTLGGRRVFRTVRQRTSLDGEPKPSAAASSEESIACHVPPRPSVAIIGFRRLGKCLLGLAVKDNVNVVAINEPFADIKSMASSIKRELAKANINEKVNIEGDKLRINDKLISVCHEKNPENINWRQLGAEYIIDSTENCTDLVSKMKHISPGGAKKMIITVPSEGVETFFKGVNYEKYQKTMSVVSNGSCTGQCAAPLMDIIHQNFVITSYSLKSTCVLYTTDDYLIYDANDAGSATRDIASHMRTIIRNVNTIPEPHIPSVAYLKLHFRLDRNVSIHVVKFLFHQEVVRDNSVITAHRRSNKLDVYRFGTSRYSAIVDVNRISVKDNCIVIGAWYNTVTGSASRALDLVNHMKEVDDENQRV